jgi:RNA 3'-terminal phosphate cyclase
MAKDFEAGTISINANSILFDPRPLGPGTFRFESDHLSSAVELLLFMMPALFQGDFRSILELGGVTHSPFSFPTAFIKETVLAALEQVGLYGSLTLRRFGFYGSGGGSMESRLYPREKVPGTVFSGTAGPSISGAKIFISRLDTGLAELEKGMIAERLGIGADRIAIIEVMESDGPGNGIQVFASHRGTPVVLFREMRLYNEKGGLGFTEETLGGVITDLAGEARSLMDGRLPEPVFREVLPYCAMTGTEPPGFGESAGAAMTRELCARLL